MVGGRVGEDGSDCILFNFLVNLDAGSIHGAASTLSVYISNRLGIELELSRNSVEVLKMLPLCWCQLLGE